MSDRDGWFTNPIDESVMGPAQALAAEKMRLYRTYSDGFPITALGNDGDRTRLDHMNRMMPIDRAARRRSIAMRVLALTPFPSPRGRGE